MSGLTAKAKLEGKVHGVVVHTINLTSLSSTNGKFTYKDGSLTSL